MSSRFAHEKFIFSGKICTVEKSSKVNNLEIDRDLQ